MGTKSFGSEEVGTKGLGDEKFWRQNVGDEKFGDEKLGTKSCGRKEVDPPLMDDCSSQTDQLHKYISTLHT